VVSLQKPASESAGLKKTAESSLVIPVGVNPKIAAVAILFVTDLRSSKTVGKKIDRRTSAKMQPDCWVNTLYPWDWGEDGACSWVWVPGLGESASSHCLIPTRNRRCWQIKNCRVWRLLRYCYTSCSTAIPSGSVKVNSMQISWFSASFGLSDPLLIKQQKMGVGSRDATSFGPGSYLGLELSFKVNEWGAPSQILGLSLEFWAAMKIPA